MKRLAIAVAGLALVAALAAHGSAVQAQPVASITLPEPGRTVQLYPGCNNIALSFPDGTPSQTVVQAVTPAGSVQSMWRHNAAQNRFEGFSPAAPQASDLLVVNFLDAVWICVTGLTPESLAHYDGECFAFDYPSDWHLTKGDCPDPHPCHVESATVGKLDAPGCPTSQELEAGDVRIGVGAYGLFPHGACEDAETCLENVQIDRVNTAVCFSSYGDPAVAYACTALTIGNTTFHIAAASAETNPDWTAFWNFLASLELRDCAPVCWCDGFC